MRVVIGNTTYSVRFTHQNEQSDTDIKPRFTECKITVDGEQFSGVGYAKVHPKDNFCKEKGRKMALSRALDDSGFKKEDKVIFWNEYRKWGKNRF